MLKRILRIILLTVLLALCQLSLFAAEQPEEETVTSLSSIHRWSILDGQNASVTLATHPNSRRRRRDIFHLYNMMTCATGCDPLKYKGYGCYCGFLGSGAAMDGIDRCCKMHDYCYGASVCQQSVTYFVPYKWTCNRGRPHCVTGPGRPRGHQLCSYHLCECDRQFAECISRYPCPNQKLTCASNPIRNIG